MDWKEFRVEPEDGVFERIQHRVRVRRAWRIGGVAAGAAAVIVAAVLLVPKAGSSEGVSQLATAEVPESVIGHEEIQAPDGVQRQLTNAANQEDVVGIAAERKQTGEVADRQAGGFVADAPRAALDDADEVASLLPQTSLTVKHVDEAAAESDSRIMHCAPIYIGPADEKDTTSPVVVIPSFDAPKSDPPQPEPYHEDNLLWVPNIIVPGGDWDEDRYFRIVTSSPISEFVIHIYNRGGRLLYSTTDPSFQWDATHNGTPVPQGAYVYVATFRDTDGNPRQQTGTVTVIR